MIRKMSSMVINAFKNFLIRSKAAKYTDADYLLFMIVSLCTITSFLFLKIFAENIDCGYTLVPSRQVPTIYVLK